MCYDGQHCIILEGVINSGYFVYCNIISMFFFFFFFTKVWEGLNVVKTGRVMLGETNPVDSKPGTIRGDLCVQVGRYILKVLI